jgi:hypothetical protein
MPSHCMTQNKPTWSRCLCNMLPINNSCPIVSNSCPRVGGPPREKKTLFTELTGGGRAVRRRRRPVRRGARSRWRSGRPRAQRRSPGGPGSRRRCTCSPGTPGPCGCAGPSGSPLPWDLRTCATGSPAARKTWVKINALV